MSNPNFNITQNPNPALNIDSRDASESFASSKSSQVDSSAKVRQAYASDSTARTSQNLEMTDLRSSSQGSDFRADIPKLAQPDTDEGAARQLAKDQAYYSDPTQLNRLYNSEYQR